MLRMAEVGRCVPSIATRYIINETLHHQPLCVKWVSVKFHQVVLVPDSHVYVRRHSALQLPKVSGEAVWFRLGHSLLSRLLWPTWIRRVQPLPGNMPGLLLCTLGEAGHCAHWAVAIWGVQGHGVGGTEARDSAGHKRPCPGFLDLPGMSVCCLWHSLYVITPLFISGLVQETLQVCRLLFQPGTNTPDSTAQTKPAHPVGPQDKGWRTQFKKWECQIDLIPSPSHGVCACVWHACACVCVAGAPGAYVPGVQSVPGRGSGETDGEGADPAEPEQRAGAQCHERGGHLTEEGTTFTSHQTLEWASLVSYWVQAFAPFGH